MSDKAFYHIRPAPNGGWEVKRAGADRASGHFDRKALAVAHARDLAERLGSGLVIYSKDGRIQETTVRPLGYGSLRGKYAFRKGIDLTKPIYEQVLKLEKKRGRARSA